MFYDRVSWTFLFEMLQSRNLNPMVISWFKQVVMSGSIGIMLNGKDSAYFKAGKGLRLKEILCLLFFLI